MLSEDAAGEACSFIRGDGQEAAQRFLTCATLLRKQVSPPRDRRARAAWEARQQELRDEAYRAAMELERFLHIHQLACGGLHRRRKH